ncbi:uncharacterized protein BO87DRAFT_462428 [Aspergillus neoniger CBS 115656]|uniref:Carboxymuconolactone decarboxylase-like domain-containing protein n=1 Tax=Aspergillus neoniger (strain CBS 115656) TaxID=1448310 RepID=A0A318Y773_ASPNB|nr:hypothetical protein BO87DRAFT_462428 [Aspergillus neoniger CBS 115656]PYH30146.1 hypothetical protein BO87DRAFT_462428 [Aspergillus neoniger CBS 115656]
MTKDSELSHLHETLFEQGIKLRRAVVGDAYVDRALAQGSSDFSRPGQELVTEWCWDLGMLIALKTWPELAFHTRGAIINGLTEKEISEAVLQATFYCGGPSGTEATKVTERAINEMIANGEYKRE